MVGKKLSPITVVLIVLVGMYLFGGQLMNCGAYGIGDMPVLCSMTKEGSAAKVLYIRQQEQQQTQQVQQPTTDYGGIQTLALISLVILLLKK